MAITARILSINPRLIDVELKVEYVNEETQYSQAEVTLLDPLLASDDYIQSFVQQKLDYLNGKVASARDFKSTLALKTFTSTANEISEVDGG